MAKIFKLEKSEATTFDFQIGDSEETHSVPLLSKLPIALLIKAQKYAEKLNGDEELNLLDFYGFMSEIFEPYAPGVVESLNPEQAAYLFRAYNDASIEGVSVSPVGE